MSKQDEAGKAKVNPKAKAPYASPKLRIYGPVTQLTKGASGSKGDGALKKIVQSDRRLKQSIRRVGEHASGIGLYLYEYRPEFAAACGRGTFLGVMADEVQAVIPAAVSVDAQGYLAVDYAML